ncbi:hypothetical protein ACA29_12730 [Lederbergia galactosidilytica]|uniref:Uncharacterized protein n=1 Tax=Lederbergia galactosidilytica TaxID=217031 RepID=A0A0Q9XUM0_9BACI|nr:hypothetical protein ACA29_12730 [Lederbergia galactosidilytica]
MAKERENEVEIMAIWEYDSLEDFKMIEDKVREDHAHIARVRNWYEKMGGSENLKNIFYKSEQDFFESTVL